MTKLTRQQREFANRFYKTHISNTSIEDKCLWKLMVDVDDNPEGNMRWCKHRCNGYDTSCKEYVSKVQLVNR